MLEFIIDEVKDRAAIGIISEPIEDGGLPAPDKEVCDIEGDSEYERPSCGAMIGADNIACDDDEEPYT
jgi:hypothetical protein